METIITINNSEMDYATAVNLMDDEIREKLHANLAPCTNQEFYDAYCESHKEKFGEEFVIN